MKKFPFHFLTLFPLAAFAATPVDNLKVNPNTGEVAISLTIPNSKTIILSGTGAIVGGSGGSTSIGRDSLSTNSLGISGSEGRISFFEGSTLVRPNDIQVESIGTGDVQAISISTDGEMPVIVFPGQVTLSSNVFLNGPMTVHEGAGIQFLEGELDFSGSGGLNTIGAESPWDLRGVVFTQPFSSTQKAALGLQPLDSDLTAIAALGTTSVGRSLLAADNGSFPAIRTGYFTAARAVAVWDLDADLPMIAANLGELEFTNFSSVYLDADARFALQSALGIAPGEFPGGDNLSFLGAAARFSAQAASDGIGLFTRGSDSGIGSFAAVVEAPNGPGLKISQDGEHTDLSALYVRRTGGGHYTSPLIQVLGNEGEGPSAPILSVKYQEGGERNNDVIDARGDVIAQHIGARYQAGTSLAVGGALGGASGYSLGARLTDNAGILSLENDTASPAGSVLFTITFSRPYAVAPAVVVQSANQNAESDLADRWLVITAYGFEVHSFGVPAAGYDYRFTYTVTSLD